MQRLDPRLTDVLNDLEGSPVGQAFKDRAVELASSAAFAGPVDYRATLRPHLWLLERAASGGLPLTAAGYLKPAHVREFAAVLPTMRDWIFPMAREVDVRPVFHFREYLKLIGLLRKYKGTLRATTAGKRGVADAATLWDHLAATLVPTASAFAESAGVVVLIHMATTEGWIDVDVVARTMTQLGWSRADGSPVVRDDVYPIWNYLWVALGNVGDVGAEDASAPDAGSLPFDRHLSRDAVALIRTALFTEVG